MDGSILCRQLLEAGHTVIGTLRRSSTDNTSRIKDVKDRITLKELDITDAYNVSDIFKLYKPDQCFNMIAQSHVGTSFDQPVNTFEVDALGVLHVLEAIRRESPNTRLVHASSSEMFGSCYSTGEETGRRFKNSYDIKYQDENTQFCPQSPYSVAKLAAHNMVGLYRKAYGLHASCSISFNHEGPYRTPTFVTRKITKWIGEYKNWANTKLIDFTYADPLFAAISDFILSDQGQFSKLRLGNIESFRDWANAEDMCRGFQLMANQDKPDDYVLATGETHSIKEFLTEAFSYAGLGDWQPYVVIDKAFMRPAEVDYLCGRSDKAKRILGWEPKTDFKQLVRLMVDYDVQTSKKDL